MAIYGHTRTTRGQPDTVYLKKEFEVLLGAIAAELSNSHLGPHDVSRSQLTNKAIENYIEECRTDSTLKVRSRRARKTERRSSQETEKRGYLTAPAFLN
jgi:hypothetical protein